MNPAIARLNAQKLPQMFQEARARVEGLKSLQTPQAALEYLVKQNPAMKQAMEYVNQNGGDPKEAFRKLAQEMGIDRI